MMTITLTQQKLVAAFERLQSLHIQYDDHDAMNDQVIQAEREYQRLLHQAQAERRKQAQQVEA